MKPIISLFILAFMLSAAQIIQADESKADAQALVTSADKAVGYIVKAARTANTPKLSQDVAESKQFWAALKKLNEAVDKTQRGLALQDQTFFTAMADASSAVEELHIAYDISGARVPDVKQGIQTARQAIEGLQQNFSLEAKMRDQNKPLSEKEKAQLKELKEKQAELEKKLAEVEAKSGNNAKAIAGIEKARGHMRRIHNCHYDAGGFFAAMMAWSIIDGIIWGWSPWWGWGWWGGWWGPIVSIDIIDITIIDAYDWDYVADELDIAALELDMTDAELLAAEAYIEGNDFEIDSAITDQLVEDDIVEEAVQEAIVEEAVQESVRESIIEDAVQESIMEESLDGDFMDDGDW